MDDIDKLNAIQQTQDIQNILRSEVGRRFVWRILSYCGVYHDLEGTYEDMLKQAGRRQAGLYLIGIINEVDDGEALIKMMKEARNKDKEDNYARERQQQLERAQSDEYTPSHDYDAADAFRGYNHLI